MAELKFCLVWFHRFRILSGEPVAGNLTLGLDSVAVAIASGARLMQSGEVKDKRQTTMCE
jgi:hypothetical protein